MAIHENDAYYDCAGIVGMVVDVAENSLCKSFLDKEDWYALAGEFYSHKYFHCGFVCFRAVQFVEI